MGNATAGLTCPDCTGTASAAAQRRHLEQLAAEVDEARQENQRLNKLTNRLRAAVADAQQQREQREMREPPLPSGNFNGAGLQELPAQERRAINDELLQLKRALWEAQRENAELRAAALAPDARLDTGARRGPGRGTVSMAQYRAVREQYDELQRAHDAAAAQHAKRRQSSQASSPAPSTSSAFRQQPPARAPPLGGPCAGFGGARLGSTGGSRQTSGKATPLGGSAHDAHPAGSAAPGGPDEAEFSRRVAAMQAENEELRRKVRLLAAR